MRKIHNIHDLQEAKHAVAIRRHQLEKELQQDWKEVK